VFVGLLFAVLLMVLGVAAGRRHLRLLRQVRIDEPYLPEVDQRYFRKQGQRRFIAALLLVVVGVMIGAYYVSGMDARMDEIGNRTQQGLPPADEAQAEAEKEFARFVGIYWIAVILLLGVVVCVAVIDFWATRVYWMARYREIKTDHETKLRRDLAVYRTQKLNSRAKGLKPPSDDTTPGS